MDHIFTQIRPHTIQLVQNSEQKFFDENSEILDKIFQILTHQDYAQILSKNCEFSAYVIFPILKFPENFRFINCWKILKFLVEKQALEENILKSIKVKSIELGNG